MRLDKYGTTMKNNLNNPKRPITRDVSEGILCSLVIGMILTGYILSLIPLIQ